MLIILKEPLGEEEKKIFALQEGERIQFDGELCYIVQQNETNETITNSIIPIWNIVAVIRK